MLMLDVYIYSISYTVYTCSSTKLCNVCEIEDILQHPFPPDILSIIIATTIPHPTLYPPST
jgi:hypothetical protein